MKEILRFVMTLYDLRHGKRVVVVCPTREAGLEWVKQWNRMVSHDGEKFDRWGEQLRVLIPGGKYVNAEEAR